jgi:class 3 adenylate cyclase
MYPVVIVRQPNRRPLHLQVAEPVELGRECDGLLLVDRQTSRRHARLEPRGTDVLVEDLGSTNGSFLDGTRFDSSVVLRLGSTLRIGDTTVELQQPPAPGAVPAGSRAPAAQEAGVVVGDAAAPAGIRETSIDVVARSVRQETTELAHDYEGTVTIVFSDIESSTERAAAVGDTVWMKLLAMHNEIVRRHLVRAKGREVKNQGDGFMLTFPGARRALQCIAAIQRDLAAVERDDPEYAVRVRVGVHTGEVIAENGDIFGRHVMMAARVAGEARGGEVLVSALVHEIASARGDLTFGPSRRVTFRGFEGEHLVYPLMWDDAGKR